MNFKDVINSGQAVLVEFYASWCPHCQRMMPIVAQVKELLDGQVKVEQFDIDKYPDLANEARADAVPTFILFRDGKEVWRESGELDGQVLLSKIQSFL